MLEKLLGKSDEEYETVGKIGDYELEEDRSTMGRPYMDGFRPKIGYNVRNYKLKEEGFFGDKEKVLLTDEEYDRIRKMKIDNPSKPFGVKKQSKTVGEYLEEKGAEVEISLWDDEGEILKPYRSGEFVNNVRAAKKVLYGDDEMMRSREKGIYVRGENSDMLLKPFFHTEPESPEEFENRKIFYRDIEFLD